MSNEDFTLSRRKTLAALGTIGVASAGAGLGTSAYFSDQETFENNRLVAGELDLKVDWEEHYSDWSADEAAAAPGVRMVDSPDDVGDGEIGLPDPENPLLAVPDDQLGAFMDATAIEAYPDDDAGGDGDGVQDPLTGYDACTQFADTPEDLDPNGGTGLRTANADTLDEADDPKPLVSLADIKPGDFGELTLSFHLCDNPGYVWLQGRPVTAAENGTTEPEADDPQEVGAADESYDVRPDDSDDTPEDILNADVELLDEIRTLLWYDDDGDNVYEPGAGGEATDVMLVFDKSESMNSFDPEDTRPEKLQSAIDGAQTLVDALGDNTRAGLALFSDTNNTGLARGLGSAKEDIKDDLGALNGPNDYTPNNGNTIVNDEGGLGNTADEDNLNFETQTGVGIEAARQELLASNPDSKKIMVILSDGIPVNDPLDADTQAQLSKDEGIEIYTIAYGSGADVSQMAGWASDPTETHAFVAPDPNDVEAVFGQLGQILGGEECFFRGSLRDLLTELDSGLGIPLDGNRETPFDEIDGDAASEAREEFVESTNNFVGVAWYLPVDHANQIQSDSVGFDLGFYVEQSRHNDGSGMAGNG